MKRILIIDDDELCRRPAAVMLRRDGYEVMEACDGGSGIQVLETEGPFDVVITDLLMPRMNGYQVCRAIRNNAKMRDTRIIVLSGRDYPADRKSIEEEGVFEFLSKPLQHEVLREMLQKPAPVSSISVQPSVEPSVKPVDGEMTEIKFWGVRGSIPTPGQSTVFFGGNTACVEVRTDGEMIILDAGTGIRPLGESLVAEFAGKPIAINLLVTHTHWDHIQGFPFFLPAYDSRNHVLVMGYEGARDGLTATLGGQMVSPYFPISFRQMPGNIVFRELKEMTFSVGSVEVEACFSNHPGVCVGYKLFTKGGTVIYLPDNECFGEDEDRLQNAVLPRRIEGNLSDFVMNADILIIDSQYTADEYRSHVGWGHGCVDDVVRFALKAKVRRLFLFHHDPAHDDRFVSNMLMHAREIVQNEGGTMRVEAAREGEVIRQAKQAEESFI